MNTKHWTMSNELLALNISHCTLGEGDADVIKALLSEETVELPGGRTVVVHIGGDKDRSDVTYGRTPVGEDVFAYQVVESGGGETVVLWDSWANTEAEFRFCAPLSRGQRLLLSSPRFEHDLIDALLHSCLAH